MRLSKKNKGSIAVFLAIVFGVLAGLSIVMVDCARDSAEKSKNLSKIVLSARSVLSKYDNGLKNEYGLFATDMNTSEIEKNLGFYIRGNGIKTDDLYVTTEYMTLGNLDVFEKEIVEYSLFLLGKDMLNISNETVQREDSRVLKNQLIIGQLPSKGIKSKGISIGDFAQNMEEVDGFFDRTKKRVLVNEYILHSFNNHINDFGNTFFKNEVEYILAGKYSDKENLKAVSRKLKVVRNIANLIYIESSAEMKGAILAAAAATGVAAEVAVPMITEAWALAESKNDVQILLNGGKIPIVKNKSTWATDIGILTDDSISGYIDTKSETGMDYEDYLQVFLYLENREIKLKRTMDLMQINIQGKYNRNFLISNATTGFAYNIKLEDEVYKGTEKY